jgi:hypothetical protein
MRRAAAQAVDLAPRVWGFLPNLGVAMRCRETPLTFDKVDGVARRRLTACRVSKNLRKRSQADKDFGNELFDTRCSLIGGVFSLSTKRMIFARFCPLPFSVACPLCCGLPACTWTRPRAHGSHRITGTVERLLKGDPSTTRVLYARYTSVRCARSTILTTRVSLNRSDVFSLRRFLEKILPYGTRPDDTCVFLTSHPCVRDSGVHACSAPAISSVPHPDQRADIR